jgi:8-oxo-dGTP pyrophosphatase MutT (NUDIX family)
MKIAAGVLIKNPDDSNLFLALKKKNNNPDGSLSLPCGKLEDDELPHHGARRECLEETGYSVIIPMINPYLGHDRVNNNIVWVYFAEIDDSFPAEKPQEPAEGEVVWATAEELSLGYFGEINKPVLKYFGFIS